MNFVAPAFFALFAFAIVTLWVPALWPVAVFESGVYALAIYVLARARPRFAWPIVPLGFAVLWGLAQSLAGRSAYPYATRLAMLRFAAFLAVFIVGRALFENDVVRDRLRSAMLWFGFVLSVVATLQSFTSEGSVFWIWPTPYTDYVMGPILSRNHYAAFMEAVLPMALYLAVRRERNSLLYSGMAAAIYASVIASASRAGTLLCTAEVVLVPVLVWMRYRDEGRTVATAMLRMATLFVIFTTIAGWQNVWNRFWVSDPLAIRRELNISSVHMIRDHAAAGVGLGAWPAVYPAYAVTDVGAFANEAHNDWLQWAAEGGVPLFLAMLSLFLWSIVPAYRTVWGLGVVAVFLHALVDYPFSRPALGAWPILVLALIAPHAKRSRFVGGQ